VPREAMIIRGVSTPEISRSVSESTFLASSALLARAKNSFSRST
jgi:hypothetical protein